MNNWLYIIFLTTREELVPICHGFQISEIVILFQRVQSIDFLPISISIYVGKKLHLLKMIYVIDGVNERVLSVML